MENQITRSLTTKKVIEDFKVKGTILSEEEAEKYIDLIYFFSEQAFKLYNASKTCNPVEFNSIEPKKAENVDYNLFAKKVLMETGLSFLVALHSMGADTGLEPKIDLYLRYATI